MLCRRRSRGMMLTPTIHASTRRRCRVCAATFVWPGMRRQDALHIVPTHSNRIPEQSCPWDRYLELTDVPTRKPERQWGRNQILQEPRIRAQTAKTSTVARRYRDAYPHLGQSSRSCAHEHTSKASTRSSSSRSTSSGPRTPKCCR